MAQHEFVGKNKMRLIQKSNNSKKRKAMDRADISLYFGNFEVTSRNSKVNLLFLHVSRKFKIDRSVSTARVSLLIVTPSQQYVWDNILDQAVLSERPFPKTGINGPWEVRGHVRKLREGENRCCFLLK